MRKNIKKNIFLIIALIFSSHYSLAAISLSATRAIYTEGKKEISIDIKNHGKEAVLTQNWIDDGNMQATPDALNVPFIITPPIARVNAGQGQTLRISVLANQLPKDRESVFWINVLEIPPKNKIAENTLQMAFRTRIKLFYRPTNISGKPEVAADQLVWRKISPTQLEAVNNSPWNISVANVTVGQWSAQGDLVPAFGEKTFSSKDKSRISGEKDLSFSYINDYGAERQAKSILSR